MAELKFREIARKVLFAAKAVGTLHTALEIAEEILDGVSGLAVFSDIEAALVPTVFDRLVRGKFLAGQSVKATFIGVQF